LAVLLISAFESKIKLNQNRNVDRPKKERKKEKKKTFWLIDVNEG
jgi:hypothetical protein